MTFTNFMSPNDQTALVQKEIIKAIIHEIDKAAQRSLEATRYMNKQQTCAYLQISNNTLDKWIRRGLPCISIDNTRRFDRRAIDEWLTCGYNGDTPLTRNQRSFNHEHYQN